MDMLKVMRVAAIILLLMVATGCVNTEPSLEDQRDASDDAVSDVVDEIYYLNGELKEINNNSVLVDTEEAGLVWVRLEDDFDHEISIHSIIRVQYSGAIAESYPGQATGHSLEVVTPYTKNEVDYQVVEHVYVDETNNISIQYFQVEGMAGELVMDYINQSLYEIVDMFSRDRTDIELTAWVLRQDDFLSIEYLGKVTTEESYDFVRFMTMEMSTGTVITPESYIKEWALFEPIFKERTGFDFNELEGVWLYMTQEAVVLTFVPTDDSAERLFIEFDNDEIAPYIVTEFEMPAS